MHDNTWARALAAHGAEVSLIPTYTPIRVDEQDLSTRPIFFGGINVYLEYRFRAWRKLPRWLTRPLDAPWLLNLTRLISSDASQLGALTLSMLEGETGPQRNDVAELVEYLTGQLKPDVVCFTNALMVGVLRSLKEKFNGPVFCTLQGDDIFLEDLPEAVRAEAIAKIQQRALEFDGFLVHSRYYRDFMSSYLDLPARRFHQIPLGIDLQGHDGRPVQRNNETFTVGYFARICPEKGLRQLADAFCTLHDKHPNTRLRVGGYLGKRDEPYFRDVLRKTRELGTAFEYIGSPDSRNAKTDFLKSLDVFSVPTVYHEPKGLPVLEALANGVPVVQPRHGAFPELLETTGGGLLVNPGDADELAGALERLMLDPGKRIELAAAGHANVRIHYDLGVMAQATLEIFERALQD